jgi:uncharacterized protein YuzE
MTPVKFEYDKKADAAYIWLRRGVKRAYGKSLDDRRYVDYGADDKPIGVELLGVSRGVETQDLPEQQVIERVLTKHHVKLYA